MLNYSEFQQVQGNRRGFKFKKMMPLNDQMNVYADSATKKKYNLTIFTSHQQFSIFQSLCKKEIFGNIAGLLKKKNHYYCFSCFDGFQTLSEYIEKYCGEKQLISEFFCTQLIEQIADIVKKVEANGVYLKILTPFSIILTEMKNNQFKFQLKFPLPFSLFEGLSMTIAQREIQFCAPEILLMMDNEQDLSRSKFAKASLYSLGLVLLYCFGYRIKSEERILALKKSKEFKIFLKAIRKEIKLFHEGKFISKLIKILMEENEFVRDNSETFLMKLRSSQLQSLRKFIFKPPQQAEKQAYIPTIYSDYSDQVRKSGLNRTIEIRLSSMSNSQNRTHQKSDHQGLDSSNNYNLALFATFRKSPQNLKYHEEMIKEVPEDQKEEQDPRIQVPSPIEIHLDWDDEEEPNNSMLTPKKQTNQGDREMNRIHYDFPEDDLKIKINNCDLERERNKQRFLYSQGKSSRGSNKQHLKRSSKSNEGSSRLQQIDEVEAQIESKSQLKTHFANKSQPKLHKSNDKYHVMVEEQPDIIKYSENDYKIGPSPRLSRRKSSKNGSNDLQDMTLIEQSPDDDEQEMLQTEQKNGNNYQQIKIQFNKKSEAIFITLLVNFLIYKIIDYFVQ